MEQNYVSGSNQFNEEDFNFMVELLSNGDNFRVGIECIGFTRNNMEQEHYKRALINEFGDKLEISTYGPYFCYSYGYKLKEN